MLAKVWPDSHEFKIPIISAATMFAAVWTANAALVNYSVDGWSQQFPGPVTPPAGAPHSVDGWGYPGDMVTLQAGSGAGYSFDLVDGATHINMPIGTLAWGVDYTYNSTETAWDYPDYCPPLAFTINATRSIMADTTSLNFGQCAQTQGLGLIGSHADKFFGLWQHSLLAFTPQGWLLGLLDTQGWARDPAKFGGNHQRNRKPVADKESVKWLRSYEALQTHADLTPNTWWVMVADREGDLYELFALALRTPTAPGLLVRAQHDRGVEQSTRRLFAHLARVPRGGRLRVQVPRRPGQRARAATLSVRFREVRLSAPGLKADQPALTRWAVEARELHPPRGCAPLHWRLLTTCPVNPLAQATELIGWYCVRWGIEVFHKVLKSGCAVEAAQLETAARLQRYLAIKLVIAWQAQALTHLGRVQPEADVGEILAAAQWRVLRAATPADQNRGRHTPTVREAVRRLARLGGHLGRRGDGPPGALCLARGLQRLHDITLGWKLAHKRKNCA